jgi:hypothetical protein
MEVEMSGEGLNTGELVSSAIVGHLIDGKWCCIVFILRAIFRSKRDDDPFQRAAREPGVRLSLVPSNRL